jgi:hypothetical protein
MGLTDARRDLPLSKEGRMSLDHNKPCRGQTIFNQFIQKNWKRGYAMVLPDFQDGWKQITAIKQNGNSNPYYVDFINFIYEGLEARQIYEENGTVLPPPIMPFQENAGVQTLDRGDGRYLTYMSLIRGEVSVTGEDSWWLLLHLALALRFLYPRKFQPQTRGLLKFLLQNDAFADLSIFDKEKILGLLETGGYSPIEQDDEPSHQDNLNVLCETNASRIAASTISQPTLGV